VTDYTEAQIRERAERAGILLQDPLLAEMMTELRDETRNALEDVDPTNMQEIMRLQAIARCTQELFDRLAACITASGANDGGVSMEVTKDSGANSTR